MSDRGEQVYDVVRLVRPITLASARVVAQSLRQLGLTVGGRAVLELVADGGPTTVPDLARLLDVSRQAIQGLVNDAVASGHVVLMDNPRHRRSPLVGLTARGRDAFAGVRRAELRQLATLAPEDTKVLIIAAAFDGMTCRAARNHGNSLLMTADETNTQHLLRYRKIVITADAMETLARRTA